MREDTDDDDSSEIQRGHPPLPTGWVSVGPNLVVRVDGMRLTTPDTSLWDLDRLGDCPFVVEMVRNTTRGPECVQRPLVSNRLADACHEANERFPIPAWLMETDPGLPQRLDTEARDKGWLVIPRSRGAVVGVEGIELEELDVAAGYGYIAGGRPWSPSAFRVEKDRAAQRRAHWKRLHADLKNRR